MSGTSLQRVLPFNEIPNGSVVLVRVPELYEFHEPYGGKRVRVASWVNGSYESNLR